MLIQRAYKTKLHPTKAQVEQFIGHSDAVRFVWNWALGLRNAYYEHTGKHLNGRVIIKQFRAGKAAGRWPFLKPINSRAEWSAVDAQDRAFQRFFDIMSGKVKIAKSSRPRKDGKPHGYPRFKRRQDGVVAFALDGVKPEHVEDGRIRLTGFGWIRLAETGYLPTSGVKINRATVSERAGNWYVSLQVEQEIPDAKATGEPVGVDVGLKTLAVTSDGREFANPKALYDAERKLTRLSRKLARQEKGSGRRERTKQEIAKLHKRIADIRAHHAHNASAAIIGRHLPEDERPETVVIETLNVAGMLKNGRLARSVSDASMNELHRQLEYKAQWAGVQVLKADPWFASSKTCSACGSVLSTLTLGQRTYRCPDCGFSIDRDLNAAVNLRQVAHGAGDTENARGGQRPELVGSVVDVQ